MMEILRRCSMNLVILVFIIFLVSLYAYINIKYSKYSKRKLINGKTGFEISREIIDNYDLNSVYITESREELYSMYDYKRKVIKLVKGVFGDDSLTSCAISAMTASYAILDKRKDKLFTLKKQLEQFLYILIYIGYLIIIIGSIFGHIKTIWLGFGLEIMVVVFHIFTYNVERKAKEIALNELLGNKIIKLKEKKKIIELLNVSSYICIASAAFPIAELLRRIYEFGKSD